VRALTTSDDPERLSECGTHADARLVQAAERMVRDRMAFERDLRPVTGAAP